MNQTLNSSWNPEPARRGSRVDGLHVVYLVVSSLTMFTCVCGAAGNAVVVWLLSVRVRRTPFCVYMLNLAAADLLFLLCMASVLSLETPPLADRYTGAHKVARRLEYFAYTTSLSLLTAISTQRCLSVLFPVWYRSRRPRHLSTAVSALLWVLFLLVSLLASFYCSRSWHCSEGQCCAMDVVLSTLIVGVFTPVMTVSGLTLCVQVRRSALLRRRKPQRLLMVIVASVLVFLVCSLPLGLYWFVLYWLHLPPEVDLLCIRLVRLSASVGSSANPVIYFLVGSQRSQRLAEPLQAVLGRALQEEPELEGRETQSTETQRGSEQEPPPPVQAPAPGFLARSCF